MLFGSRWAAAFALVASPAIWADFESAEIAPLGGIHPDGISVYQIIVNFDDAEDTVLAVGGNDITGTDLNLKSNAPLAQDHPFGVWTDIPDARAGEGDSWFGIGGQADTAFDPELGAPGDEVVKDCGASCTGNSGYFDMDPSTPANGGSVILAQVATPGDFEFTATVYYRSSNGSNQSMDIFVSTVQENGEYLPIEDTDCNDDGISDCEAISSGSDTDVDFDGLPDSCEDDCDDDGITDPVQIDNGEEDCNQNGIPDSCEISDGSEEDCNQNGRPDSCDFADGILQDDFTWIPGNPFPDMGSNGVPDECESDCDANGVLDLDQIASSPEADANGNGILDVCETDCKCSV